MKKATSYLNSSNLSPRIKQRTDRFYGKYDHCLRAYQTEFFCLRKLDHDAIDRVVRMRQEWGRNLRQTSQPGSWSWVSMNISDDDIYNLHAMCDFLLTDTRERKLVISGSWFYIYTNDTSLIDDVSALPWLDPTKMEWTAVELIGQPGTIPRKTALHQYRTYLRSITVSSQQKKGLETLLESADVRSSPALKHWFKRDSWIKTWDYYFVDHDDNSWLLMLSLIAPGIIRKTVKIVEHK